MIDVGLGVAEEAGLPKAYALHQNFPNPFNPSTMIRFDLPEASVVTLKVYNLLGQEVATLLSDESMAAGFQQLRFDASQLPSGVYLYRLTAKGATDSPYMSVKKMMMMIK